ncbi:hypothetical protein Gasu2_47300 [Galdieria sulphuraria]|nr:hypothetical protein Gasu2_47300 [Galdieria sulphuraria]
MDPWLKALQLHRQRKKRTEGKASSQGRSWEDNNFELEQSDRDHRKFTSRRFETTLERPSLDDETAVSVSESKDYERKRRRRVKDFHDEALSESHESGHLAGENGKMAPKRSDYFEKNGLAQEQSLKDNTVARSHCALSEDSSECNTAVEASTQSSAKGRQVCYYPQRTGQESGAVAEKASTEEHQKLLEELRRIEEELEKARAWATT